MLNHLNSPQLIIYGTVYFVRRNETVCLQLLQLQGKRFLLFFQIVDKFFCSEILKFKQSNENEEN